MTTSIEWHQPHPDFYTARMPKHTLFVRAQRTGSYTWWIRRDSYAEEAGKPPLSEGTAPYLTQAKDAAVNTYNREVK